MSTETKPEVFISFNLKDFLIFFFRILPALIVFIALQIYVFNYVSKLPSLRQKGWDKMMTAHGAQPGPQGGGIIYEYQGTITQLTGGGVTVTSNNRTEKFPSTIARYTVVAPYDTFELWPTKVIKSNDSTAFKVGDQVTILIKVAPLNDLPFVSHIIKVQSQ